MTVVVTVFALSACGGGGGGGSGNAGGAAFGRTGGGSNYVAGTYARSAELQAQCASPRTGIDPFTQRAYPDRPGSALAEQLWLRSWTNELYLWYAEVPDRDPSGYTVSSYFDLLKTPAVTSTGNPKDRFHFTWATSDFQSFIQSGTSAGYGAGWALAATTPARRIVIAFIEPGSPAAAANLTRGAEILSIDGASVANGDRNVLNAGLSPVRIGESHTFMVLDLGATMSRSVTLVSANVTSTPVQNVRTVNSNGSVVGYMLFNDHIATAEGLLINAVNQLKAANVTDLVLDLRYNGGGLLDIASELAYMIAGPARTTRRTFERIQFNDKYPITVNPFTTTALAPTPFYNTTASNQSLPTLNLGTVYVLTSADTCSASESIMNGLRGVGVQVVQIGSTTCGKPYGFYPQDNCGTTYFTIEFKGVNDLGFGDYADGFSPANSATLTNAAVPGCSVADDYTHALGDPLERRFAAALSYRTSATCPIASGFAPKIVATTVGGVAQDVSAAVDISAVDGILIKSPLRENRWYQ